MVWLYKLYWFLKGEIPSETACEYCGRFSPYYYEYCPFCEEEDPDVI